MEDELKLIKEIRQKIVAEKHLITNIKVVVGMQRALDVIDREIENKRADK